MSQDRTAKILKAIEYYRRDFTQEVESEFDSGGERENARLRPLLMALVDVVKAAEPKRIPGGSIDEAILALDALLEGREK